MNDSKAVLRDFEIADIETVFGLADELGLSRWSRQDYTAELARTDSHLRVAVSQGRIAGFIVGRFVPGNDDDNSVDAEIYNIGVRVPEHRSGIGKLLLSDFLENCRSKKVKFVWLEVRKMNKKAISFYEKAGFTQFGERPGFYSDPADDGIVMRLT